MSDKPLWSPSPESVAKANITAFMALVNARHGLDLRDYAGLYRWSIDACEDFWTAVWDFGGVIAETRGERVLVDGDRMPGAHFFPDARLNFAENLMRQRDDADAMVFWGEDKVKRRMSHGELHEAVSRLQQALAAAGVKEGDRVAAFMPNMPEAVTAMLATASLAATWTSCSPDFGVQGVLDRFGQVEPAVLLCCDGYYYNGKVIDTLPRIAEIVKQLPTVKAVVVVPYVAEAPDAGSVDRGIGFCAVVGIDRVEPPLERRDVAAMAPTHHAQPILVHVRQRLQILDGRRIRAQVGKAEEWCHGGAERYRNGAEA